MGAQRSLSSAYQAVQRKRSGAEPDSPQRQAAGTWNRWSSQYSWVERAIAYDQHLTQIRLDAVAQVVEGEGAGYLQQLEEFRTIHLDAGREGMMIVLALKGAIAEYLDSPEFQITSIDEAYKTAMIIRALESGSGEMWAASLGVASLINSDRAKGS